MIFWKSTVEKWFDIGANQKSRTHLIVVQDTEVSKNYPIYVSEDEDVKDVHCKYYNQADQRIVEIYDLRKPKVQQLHEWKSFNF